MSNDPVLRVLVIEDHLSSAQALCRFLSAKYPDSITAISGNLEDGLRESVDFGADLTFLDIGIPRNSKSQDAATIKEVVESIPFFQPPVIAMTDNDDPEHHIETLCWEYGCANFFSKKFLQEYLDGTEHGVEAAKLVHSIKGAVFRDQMPKRLAARNGDCVNYEPAHA